MAKNGQPNRLIHEKSPYLLQHAYNPVDWFPWSEEAFTKAEAEAKPIFLSIGYSTCHWCHVMERESFEDQEIAEILNRSFISIKVDREERPDIDHIYMTVCQAMTGQGGWPLTVVMTPEKQPFFSGTYFPKTGQGRMVGLREILLQIADLWNTDRVKVLAAGKNISQTLEDHLSHAESSGDLDEAVLQDAFHTLKENFDPVYGGFGQAPKFPTPQNLCFLLRYWKVYHEDQALKIVVETLTHMFQGGIYDHIGYGFARYSTDEKWLIPHFEKMLYDNALLAIAYLEAYQATKNELFKEVAVEILTYIQRDMTAPEGGFYSAEDADSEGVEGKFYLWTPGEIKAILGENDGEAFCRFYDITQKGNFEGENVPNLINQKTLSQTKIFQEQRAKLLEEREKRIHPFKDDKILTSWNGLMVAAFSIAARVLEDEKWAQGAARCADFILKKLRNDNGRLLARFRQGEAAYLGYIDDYAFLTWGLIEMYQASFQPKYLQEALLLSQDLVTHFYDDQKGGFFLYGDDGEQLIARPKEIYDGATPSGNSVTALNFLKLARLTGQHEWEEKALGILRTFSPTVSQYPSGYSYLLMALLFRLSDTQEIVLVSPNGLSSLREMIREINHQFRPFTVVLAADQTLEKDIPFMKGYTPQNGQVTAYVCRNFSCQAPITDINQLQTLLDDSQIQM
ncbi:thioredoxin domain-containing protein [Dehalobacterium formicoaceticum]|uniref:thioredoxin domain-containing protein n=1 Tax=Dehalobacterium formicoaceticum TaxID=51515 RepID=UPI0031F66452